MKSEADKTLVGVLSKKDLSKPGKLVKDVYSSPPIAARPDNKVADAACLMLKHKVLSGPANLQMVKGGCRWLKTHSPQWHGAPWPCTAFSCKVNRQYPKYVMVYAGRSYLKPLNTGCCIGLQPT